MSITPVYLKTSVIYFINFINKNINGVEKFKDNNTYKILCMLIDIQTPYMLNIY